MAYNAELQALRELTYFMLPQLRCHFCEEPFLTYEQAERQGFGHRRHHKVAITFTLHHLDRNREHNSIERNIRIAHSTCHDAYHRKERQRAKEDGTQAKAGSSKEGAEG